MCRMANRVCRTFLLLVVAMSVRSACAEQLPLKIYTAAGGLASDRIRCILSDSHGFLWFGTEDGISRFDGYGFTNDTLSDGLRGAGVRSIVESRDGTYWVATNRGIVHSDPGRRGRPGCVERFRVRTVWPAIMCESLPDLRRKVLGGLLRRPERDRARSILGPKLHGRGGVFGRNLLACGGPERQPLGRERRRRRHEADAQRISKVRRAGRPREHTRRVSFRESRRPRCPRCRQA